LSSLKVELLNFLNSKLDGNGCAYPVGVKRFLDNSFDVFLDSHFGYYCFDCREVCNDYKDVSYLKYHINLNQMQNNIKFLHLSNRVGFLVLRSNFDDKNTLITNYRNVNKFFKRKINLSEIYSEFLDKKLAVLLDDKLILQDIFSMQ